MKTLLYLLFICILFPLFSNGQAPTIQWQKSLGGTQGDDAYSVKQTKDGGYIVAGQTSSGDGDVTGQHHASTYDYWVVKLSKTGNLVWNKALGGIDQEAANDIEQTSDKGYIVAGYSYSSDGDVTGHHPSGYPSPTADCWIVKLNSTGEIVWQKSLGGSGDDRAYSIQQTKDGGYIIAGYSNSSDGDVTGNHGGIGVNDYWVVKTDSTGNITWEKSLGGTDADIAESVHQTKDGGYIVAGYASSNDGDVSGHHGGSQNKELDYWVVKLSSTGNITWQKTLGGPSSDDAHSIEQTYDKGYIVAGQTFSVDGDVTGNHGFVDYWITKLNTKGKIQWQKCLGGTGLDVGFSVQQTKDSGYVVAGYSNSLDGDVSGNHSSADYWMVKLNSTGSIVWEKSLGGTQADNAFSIQQTKDGGYVLAGLAYSDNGDVTGHHGSNQAEDFWVVKLNPAMSPLNSTANKSYGNSAIIDFYTGDVLFDIAPNPVQSEIRIESNRSLQNALISITDLRGKVLFTATQDLPVSDFITVPAVSLDPGMYILSVQAGRIKRSMKIIKQ